MAELFSVPSGHGGAADEGGDQRALSDAVGWQSVAGCGFARRLQTQRILRVYCYRRGGRSHVSHVVYCYNEYVEGSVGAELVHIWSHRTRKPTAETRCMCPLYDTNRQAWITLQAMSVARLNHGAVTAGPPTDHWLKDSVSGQSQQ